MNTWSTKRIHSTITVGLSDETPKQVFFSGDALSEPDSDGVQNVSDDVASEALREISKLADGARFRFARWTVEGDSVVGDLVAI
jgi:hypothetical protein